MVRVRHTAWILGLLAGCGGGALGTVDSGADAIPTLSLTVTTTPPAFDGLVLTSGEIELERLGLFGDSSHDQRTEIPRITFPLGAPPQTIVYDMATPGLYSRLDTVIDHVALYGTWRGNPMSIHTNGDERLVDLPCAAEELSATSAATFSLTIDGTQWVDAALLDGLASSGALADADEYSAPATIDAIMARVVPSFSVTAP